MNNALGFLGFSLVMLIISLVIALIPDKPMGSFESIVKETPVSDLSPKLLQIDCPTRKKAISAGWSVTDAKGNPLDGSLLQFDATVGNSGWIGRVDIKGSAPTMWRLQMRVACVQG